MRPGRASSASSLARATPLWLRRLRAAARRAPVARHRLSLSPACVWSQPAPGLCSHRCTAPLRQLPWRITTHSSRSRFAARLNSGVRRHGKHSYDLPHRHLFFCNLGVSTHSGQIVSLPERPVSRALHQVRFARDANIRQVWLCEPKFLVIYDSSASQVSSRSASVQAVRRPTIAVYNYGSCSDFFGVRSRHVEWLCRLTIRSSRSRFAARLNSGVRRHGNCSGSRRRSSANVRLARVRGACRCLHQYLHPCTYKRCGVGHCRKGGCGCRLASALR